MMISWISLVLLGKKYKSSCRWDCSACISAHMTLDPINSEDGAIGHVHLSFFYFILHLKWIKTLTQKNKKKKSTLRGSNKDIIRSLHMLSACHFMYYKLNLLIISLFYQTLFFNYSSSRTCWYIDLQSVLKTTY